MASMFVQTDQYYSRPRQTFTNLLRGCYEPLQECDCWHTGKNESEQYAEVLCICQWYTVQFCADREINMLAYKTNGGSQVDGALRIRIVDDGQTVESPSLDEVKNTFKKLKNNNLKPYDEIIIKMPTSWRQRNGSVITQSHVLLGFADNIDIIGIDCRAVEEVYATLKKETARIDFTINSGKTKYMIAGRDRGRPSGVSAEAVTDRDVFEVVKEFVYLGTLMTMTFRVE